MDNLLPALGVDFGGVIHGVTYRPDGADTFLEGTLDEALATPAMPGALEALARLNKLFEGRVWVVVLSLQGLRHFRALLATGLTQGGPGGAGRPRPWKVVRHRRRVDPYLNSAEICSAHVTEAAASGARERDRAKFVRAFGHSEAARWVWTTVADPAGVIAGAELKRPPGQQIGSP